MFLVSPKPSLTQARSLKNQIKGHLTLLFPLVQAAMADVVMTIGDTREKSVNVVILTLNPAYGSVNRA